jgi:hypothetical protein
MMPSEIPFPFLSFESSHYGQILRYQLQTQTQKPVLITRTGKVSLDLFHALDKDTSMVIMMMDLQYTQYINSIRALLSDWKEPIKRKWKLPPCV